MYQSLDLSSGAPVAVKILAPELLDHPYFLERFQRECSAVRSVDSGVPKVFDLGHEDEIGPYLVMELLEGRTLADYLRDTGALSLGESVQITREIVTTLEAVHAAGVVHRDLKPANVFLVGEKPPWSVKVLDFGVARFWELSRDTVLTFPGSVVGTPRYMPPEQATDASQAEPRCDLYAAGAILYSCLSGLPPYHEHSGAEVAVAVLAGPPKSLSELAPQVPGALAWVAERAMAREPSDRFQDARAMREALDAAVQRVADAWADGYAEGRFGQRERFAARSARGARSGRFRRPGRWWRRRTSLQAPAAKPRARPLTSSALRPPCGPPLRRVPPVPPVCRGPTRPRPARSPRALWEGLPVLAAPVAGPMPGPGAANDPAFAMPPAFGSPPNAPTPAFGPGSNHALPLPPVASSAGTTSVGGGTTSRGLRPRRRLWLWLGLLAAAFAVFASVVLAIVWSLASEDGGGMAELPDPLPPFAVPFGVSGRPRCRSGLCAAGGGRPAGLHDASGRGGSARASLGRTGRSPPWAARLHRKWPRKRRLVRGRRPWVRPPRSTGPLQRDYLDVLERAPPKRRRACTSSRRPPRAHGCHRRAHPRGAPSVAQWRQAAAASYRAATAAGALPVRKADVRRGDRTRLRLP